MKKIDIIKCSRTVEGTIVDCSGIPLIGFARIQVKFSVDNKDFIIHDIVRKYKAQNKQNLRLVFSQGDKIFLRYDPDCPKLAYIPANYGKNFIFLAQKC